MCFVIVQWRAQYSKVPEKDDFKSGKALCKDTGGSSTFHCRVHQAIGKENTGPCSGD